VKSYAVSGKRSCNEVDINEGNKKSNIDEIQTERTLLSEFQISIPAWLQLKLGYGTFSIPYQIAFHTIPHENPAITI
jgi:hypothetical protein